MEENKERQDQVKRIFDKHTLHFSDFILGRPVNNEEQENKEEITDAVIS